jgi:hypothetical protein
MATLEECVKPLLIEKANEEILNEMLAISFYGKEYLKLKSERRKEFFKRKALRELEEIIMEANPTKEKIINQILKNMEDAITEGLGIFDIFRDMDKYSRQLQEGLLVTTKALAKKAEEIEDEEWLKELRKVEKRFENIRRHSCNTAKKLEEAIVTLLIDAYLRTLPNEEKKKIFQEIEKLLKKIGKLELANNSDKKLILILTHSGLLGLKQILGFQFHIILAIVINAIWNITGGLIVGKGLSLAVNALIQRIAAIALGPIGWIIAIGLSIPAITKLLNPREFDKYLPLVVYIYFLRHQDDLGAAIGATVGKPNGPLSGKEAGKLKRKPEEEE